MDLLPHCLMKVHSYLQLREACHRQDREACKALLEQIKQNYTLLNSKLEVFMSLEQRGKQLLAS